MYYAENVFSVNKPKNHKMNQYILSKKKERVGCHPEWEYRYAIFKRLCPGPQMRDIDSCQQLF